MFSGGTTTITVEEISHVLADLKSWSSNANALQMDEDTAKQWSLDWHPLLDGEKCVHMSFGGDSASAFVVHVCYVDDTFVVVKRDDVNSFHDYLNSLSPHIKFSMEIESTWGTLNFLNRKTHKVGGKLKTTIYRKPIGMRTVLNYSSAHPKSVYASIFSSMFRRVKAQCMEEIDRTAAQIEIANTLQEIGYPVSLIRRQLRKILAPVSRPSKEWIGTAVTPYKAGTSEGYQRLLNLANIRVAFQKGKTLLSVLVQLKDPLPAERTSDCVYKINCNDCAEVYIGQTARELHTRIVCYVDDTFVVVKRDDVNSFHDYLNSLSPHIKFSMEIESTWGTLNFLNRKTHKVGGKLKTTIYRKPIGMRTVLNYSSAHPKSVYASIFSSMFRRVKAQCMEEIDRTAAQIEIANTLQEIGYPVSLIRRQLRKILAPVSRPSKEWIGTAVTPYKAGTSEGYQRLLNLANIRVAFQKGKTLLSVLVQLKDPLPAERTSDCVYKINCNDCAEVYIGQTARELHTRIGEHKRRINKPPRDAENQTLIKDPAMALEEADTDT
ncbi:hypothetical protein T265_11997 [Opisthorchis viverrini]|uniref:Helix-turn-helix domain-containing protein n=1 Tax=Opisthorchis viverrini TaxID=6198 RepID=A0A074YWR8_OPIVI|nr:hypothetical protein T265_11997 [Opisthorchis viverrini]KER19118.1 hypothetical protein T265_11997 [Opisthorchis viverrini]